MGGVRSGGYMYRTVRWRIRVLHSGPPLALIFLPLGTPPTCSCSWTCHHAYALGVTLLPTFLSLLVELQLEHRAVVQRLDGSAIVVHTLHLAQRLAEALDLGLHRHRRGG